MKKNRIFMAVLTISTQMLCLALLIFCKFSQIPTLISQNGLILAMGSKWLLAISIGLCITFLVLSLTLKNKTLKTIFCSLCLILVFENLLLTAYFSIEKTFALNELFKIPSSILIFLPISALCLIFANILKTLPYKSCFGIKNKYSLETEFLWTQVQIIAKDKFLLCGIILTLVSLIFCFFNLFFVELALFAAIICITHLIIRKEAKAIFIKYQEMQKRKENLSKKQD